MKKQNLLIILFITLLVDEGIATNIDIRPYPSIYGENTISVVKWREYNLITEEGNLLTTVMLEVLVDSDFIRKNDSYYTVEMTPVEGNAFYRNQTTIKSIWICLNEVSYNAWSSVCSESEVAVKPIDITNYSNNWFDYTYKIPLDLVNQSGDHHIRIQYLIENPFRMVEGETEKELYMQSYCNSVYGYCEDMEKTIVVPRKRYSIIEPSPKEGDFLGKMLTGREESFDSIELKGKSQISEIKIKIEEKQGYFSKIVDYIKSPQGLIPLLLAILLFYLRKSGKKDWPKKEIKAKDSSIVQSLEVGKQEGVIKNIQTVLKINNQTKPVLLEIYTSLHWEVQKMSGNISSFKTCFHEQYDRPDYSPPAPPREILGEIRKKFIETGVYYSIPEGIREALDKYYKKCKEVYEPLLTKSQNLIRKTLEEEITPLKKTEIKTSEPSQIYDILEFLKRDEPTKINESERCLTLTFFNSNELYSSVLTAPIAVDDINKKFKSIDNFIDHLHQKLNKNKDIIELKSIARELKNPDKILDTLQIEIRRLLTNNDLLATTSDKFPKKDVKTIIEPEESVEEIIRDTGKNLYSSPLSPILHKCIVLAKKLGRDKDVEWLERELYGWGVPIAHDEMVDTSNKEIYPDYRRVNTHLTIGFYGLSPNENMEMDFPVFESRAISQIEDLIKEFEDKKVSELAMYIPRPKEFPTAGLPAPDKLPLITNIREFKKIVNAVRSRISKFILDIK